VNESNFWTQLDIETVIYSWSSCTTCWRVL